MGASHCRETLKVVKSTCRIAEESAIKILEKGEYACFVDGKMVIEATQGDITYELTVTSVVDATMLFNNKVYTVAMKKLGSSDTPRTVQACLRTDAPLLSSNDVDAFIWSRDDRKLFRASGDDVSLEDSDFVDTRLATAQFDASDRWTLKVGAQYKNGHNKTTPLVSEVAASMIDDADKVHLRYTATLPSPNAEVTESDMVQLRPKVQRARQELQEQVDRLHRSMASADPYTRAYLRATETKLRLLISHQTAEMARHEHDLFEDEVEQRTEAADEAHDNGIGDDAEEVKRLENDQVTVLMNKVVQKYIDLDKSVALIRSMCADFARMSNTDLLSIEDTNAVAATDLIRGSIQESIDEVRTSLTDHDKEAKVFIADHKKHDLTLLSSAKDHAKYDCVNKLARVVEGSFIAGCKKKGVFDYVYA